MYLKQVNRAIREVKEAVEYKKQLEENFKKSKSIYHSPTRSNSGKTAKIPANNELPGTVSNAVKSIDIPNTFSDFYKIKNSASHHVEWSFSAMY